MRSRKLRTYQCLIGGLLSVLMIGLAACQTLPKSGPVYTIRVRHIDDQESYEDHKVRLGENFFLADTEYQAEISRFVPDFAINLKTKKVISRSDKPLNPALLLEVSRHGEPIYETWVLYQNPLPHGIHDPGYYFQFTAYENLD